MLSTLICLLPMASLPSAQDADIVQTAKSAGEFRTLITALEAAELTQTLSGEGPFTVFAPTDDAFAKLPKGTLQELFDPTNKSALISILTYHVVPIRADAVTALQAGEVKSVESSTLSIAFRDGRLKVGEANVIKNDIVASNGIIHVIDTVLMPPTLTPSPVVSGSRELISLALSRGVPLFNNGQPAACVAVYELTAQALVATSNDLPDVGRKALEKTLITMTSLSDPLEQAWALREALDNVYDMLSSSGKTAVETSHLQSDNTSVVFDFSKPEAGEWRLVNDDVMGGISESEFVRSENGTAVFRGALSLENNGGFCTVRSVASDLELDDIDGFELTIRGDGRTYRFGAMQSSKLMDVRVWQADLPTTPGEWTTVRIPYEALALSVMGRTFPTAPTLEPQRIRALSLSIADKNEEPFTLEIRSIGTYKSLEALELTDIKR